MLPRTPVRIPVPLASRLPKGFQERTAFVLPVPAKTDPHLHPWTQSYGTVRKTALHRQKVPTTHSCGEGMEESGVPQGHTHDSLQEPVSQDHL